MVKAGRIVGQTGLSVDGLGPGLPGLKQKQDHGPRAHCTAPHPGLVLIAFVKTRLFIKSDRTGQVGHCHAKVINACEHRLSSCGVQARAGGVFTPSTLSTPYQ